ncbi:MAG TPA: type II toxin-antitoxin system HigB family toxin [Candidatus Acidoferrum sp.]|nr:type II toxin-antitoxin system HigB family toxin [Candidatus Acidoferrum sp.]
MKAWVSIVEAARWHSFPEVCSMFKDADHVKGHVIFNIRRNRYRLITVIHYAKTTDEKQTEGHVYIRSFLTHKEYNNPDNWDRRFGAK